MYDLSNLMTLCARCHHQVEGGGVATSRAHSHPRLGSRGTHSLNYLHQPCHEPRFSRSELKNVSDRRSRWRLIARRWRRSASRWRRNRQIAARRSRSDGLAYGPGAEITPSAVLALVASSCFCAAALGRSARSPPGLGFALPTGGGRSALWPHGSHVRSSSAGIA